MLVSIPLIYILRPQHLNLNKEYLEIEYRKLGKITIDEKKDCDIDHGITDIIDFFFVA